MTRFMMTAALLSLAACGPKDSDDGEQTTDTDTEPPADTDTDGYTTDTDTDVPADSDTVDTDTDVAAACEPLTSGDWRFSGSAFGMDMLGKLQSDAAACTFTLGDWNMEMGEMPTGGTVSGSDVTLTGNGFWSSCAGTIVAPDQIQGDCGDGSTFAMQLK